MKKRAVMMICAALFSLSTAAPVFAGQWLSDANGWWWRNDDGSYPMATWQWLDGNGDGVAECYYFNEQGYCLLNTATPDGYVVDSAGAWTVDGRVQTQQAASSGKDTSRELFAKCAGGYTHTSGAGGWEEKLHLEPDGSFTGEYSDSSHVWEEGYEVLSISRYHGRFKDPVAVDSHTYKINLDGDIVIDTPSNYQHIENGVHIDYFAIEWGRNVYIYLPGTPIDQLPKEVLDWLGFASTVVDTKQGVLPCYGLYEVEHGKVFFGPDVYSD